MTPLKAGVTVSDQSATATGFRVCFGACSIAEGTPIALSGTTGHRQDCYAQLEFLD